MQSTKSGLAGWVRQSTGYFTIMPLSTKQLLRTADTLGKASLEIALLPSYTRSHEQDIFLIYTEAQQLNFLSYLLKLPANFCAKR